MSLDQSQQQFRLHRVKDCDEVDLETSLTCSVGLENVRLNLKKCSVKIERQSMSSILTRTKQKTRRPLKERFVLAKKFKTLSSHIKEGDCEIKGA